MKLNKILFLISMTGIVLSMHSCLIVKQSKYYNLIKETTIKNENFIDTIPFQMVHGHIMIEVRINGKPRKYRFVLDSGAGSYLFSHANNGNEYPVLMKKKAVDFHGSFFTYNLISVNKIQIGNMEFNNTPVANSKFPFECVEKFDGIIGANIMHLANWQIDYEKKIIIVSDDTNKFHFREDSIRIPTIVNSFVFYMRIPGSSNGVEIGKFKVDLGAALGLYLNNESIEKLIEERKLTKYIKGVGKGGEALSGKSKSFTKYSGLLDNLQLENSRFIVDNVDFTSGSGLNTIGNELLANYRVTFDYDGNGLVLEPKKQQDNIPDTSIYGFDCSLEGNKLVVSTLYEKTPAHDKGLSIGDILVEINGQDLSDCDQKTYCELDFYKFNSVSLTIKKTSGEIYKMKLHKKNMTMILE